MVLPRCSRDQDAIGRKSFLLDRRGTANGQAREYKEEKTNHFVFRRASMKQRGVFEKVIGSGVWWICYFDADSRKRREKVGRKSVAIQLYRKRKTEVMEGKKL